MSNDFGLRHPGWREAAIAVVVAGVVVAIALVAGRFGGSDPVVSSGSRSTAPTTGSVASIDRPGEVAESDVAACLADGFATSPQDVTVLYAKVQRSERGDVPVLLLRNAGGDLRLCDSFGGDAPSTVPVSYAEAAHPVRYLTNGRQSLVCDGQRVSSFAVSLWFSVADEVDVAGLRFLVDGSPGPWFTAEADGGFVHVHGWLGEQNDGAALAVHVRLLDPDGKRVEQSTVPAEPQPAGDCSHGSIDLG